MTFIPLLYGRQQSLIWLKFARDAHFPNSFLLITFFSSLADAFDTLFQSTEQQTKAIFRAA